MSSLYNFLQWLMHPNVGGASHEELVLIATVASVLWTGCIIAATIKKITVYLVMGNDMMAFAIFAPIFALLSPGLPLRLIGLTFFCFYLGQAIGYQKGNITNTAWSAPNEAPTKETISASSRYGKGTLITLAFYIPPIIWPSQIVTAWCSAAMLFFGYQFLVFVLYNVADTA